MEIAWGEKERKTEGVRDRWGDQWGNTVTKWMWRLWEEWLVCLGEAEGNNIWKDHTGMKIAGRDEAENSVLCTHCCLQTEAQVKVPGCQQISGRNHWPQATILWLVCLVFPIVSSSDSLRRSCFGLKQLLIGLPQPELIKGDTTLAPLIILISKSIPSHLKLFNWWSEQEGKQTLFHQLVWQKVTHSKKWVFFCQRPFVPLVNEVFPLTWAGIPQIDCLWSSKYSPFSPHYPDFCTEVVK